MFGLYPASTHEELVDILRWCISLVMVQNGLSSSRHSCNDIMLAQTLPVSLLDDFVGHSVVEDFSAGDLGRIELEVLMLQELIHKFSVNLHFLAHRTILVVFLLPIRVMPDNSINEYISWSGIKVVAFIHSALVVRRNETDVRDPTNVLAGSQFRRVVQDKSIEERSQGVHPGDQLLDH